MGTIRNGANGGFSGKAGSVIGSSWNNISYIKGLPKLSNKPATLKQLDQRARFSAALAFLGPIKDVLIMGYKGQASGRATGFNMGIQQVLGHAITGTYPDYSVDKELVQISKGTLQATTDIVFTSTATETLEISWLPQVNSLNAFVDDEATVLIYNVPQNLFMIYTNAGKRGDAGTTLTLPSSFAGQEIHSYIFYVSRDGNRQSNSTYFPAFTIA